VHKYNANSEAAPEERRLCGTHLGSGGTEEGKPTMVSEVAREPLE